MCVECGEGKGPVVMGLSCIGLESEPPWAPGFQVTSGPKGGQNGKACPEAGAQSLSARALGTEGNVNQRSLLF